MILTALSDLKQVWEDATEKQNKHCQFNGFPDSPVCITVSQLSCGDFLKLIAPVWCMHIAWAHVLPSILCIWCWVKRGDSVTGSRTLHSFCSKSKKESAVVHFIESFSIQLLSTLHKAVLAVWHRWTCTGLQHRNWFSAAEWRQIDKSGSCYVTTPLCKKNN